MSEAQKNKNNPLHGVKLQEILEILIEEYGYNKLAQSVKIRCFTENPSLNSCLKFLRKTPWAREKVETLFVQMKKKKEKKSQNEVHPAD
jgi:uncharacterized protein (DUF2132 family)